MINQAAELTGQSSEDVAANDDGIPIRRLGKLPSAILKYCERLLPRDWRVLQWSMETDEVVVELLERLNSAEFRQAAWPRPAPRATWIRRAALRSPALPST